MFSVIKKKYESEELFFSTHYSAKKLTFLDLSQQMPDCILAPVLKGSNYTISGSTL
jgi:hypothetical protein